LLQIKLKKFARIFKAYVTRCRQPVPNGTFDEDGAMARVGKQFGSVTGRRRRCGWLDLVALKYAVQVNGVTQLMMMKVTLLSGFETLKVCTDYNYKGEKISHSHITLSEM
jgi:adenylosuccinate synthase